MRLELEFGILGGFFFPSFSGMPAPPQPVFALPSRAFASWGGFIQKHRTEPSAKTSLISCVGAKPN